MNTVPVNLATIALAGLAAAASAQSHAVVPLANANTAGTGGDATLIDRDGSPNTYQQQFTEAELASQGLIPGMPINGLRWRAHPTNLHDPTWPPAGGATWDDYEITFAQAGQHVSDMSLTLANNMVNPVTVRSGPLHFPQGAFDNSAAWPNPNPWGPEVSISPYEYQGGDLVVLYTHNGSNIPSMFFLDRVEGDDAYGRAIHEPSFRAFSGAPSQSFVITQFSFVPAPGASALIALCGLVALRRRR